MRHQSSDRLLVGAMYSKPTKLRENSAARRKAWSNHRSDVGDETPCFMDALFVGGLDHILVSMLSTCKVYLAEKEKTRLRELAPRTKSQDMRSRNLCKT